MRNLFLFLTTCALAASVPFLPKPLDFQAQATHLSFPGWLRYFEGKVLNKLELSEREKYFNNGFPGHIARFTDGKRILVIRWVTRATRKLHPATDCFKGVGYQVEVLPLRVDNEGKRWGRFEAARNGDNALVHERIFDHAGKSWADVSAWYWAALSGKTVAPWWAITVVEFKNKN